MGTFAFSLKQILRIKASCETGAVIGRAEYSNGAVPSYLIRYQSADGSAVEQWWTEDALEVAE